MQVTPSTFTIAEYCDQLRERKIIVNREYQRNDKIWPPAAKSYLIDTILKGFPIPKLSLYQKTDLRTRKTVKEIVDGQQRSQVILDFFLGKYRLSNQSEFPGADFSHLEESQQRKFLDYPLTVDIFTAANEEDIREVFRRINSYTVILNKQEQRHATYQGAFKWFIVDLTNKYAQSLKQIGVFSEKDFVRMRDGEFFAELIFAIFDGLTSSSQPKLDGLYRKFDSNFEQANQINGRIDHAFHFIFAWEAIHKTSLMRPYIFHTLLLAIMHHLEPIEPLIKLFATPKVTTFDTNFVLPNLTSLIEALETTGEKFKPFVEACAGSTNKRPQREVRFKFLCRALQPKLFYETDSLLG